MRGEDFVGGDSLAGNLEGRALGEGGHQRGGGGRGAEHEWMTVHQHCSRAIIPYV